LDAALQDIPFDGWTSNVISNAAATLEIEPSAVRLAFPNSAMDLLTYYSKEMDLKLIRMLEASDLSEMRIREKITYAVRARLELMAPNREAARRGFLTLSLPFNAISGAQCLYGTVDAVWQGIGDTSTDFNFYSKRAILSGVYVATMAVFFDDVSEGFQKTWAFLDRRIEDVMQIEKVKANVKGVTNKLPSPFSVFDAVRAAQRRR
jgi:ubiquinone biosynthesis protein COQ9